MALITDPDVLTPGSEVIFDTTAKTIQLVKTGALSDDGIALQTLYSYTKERWQENSDFLKYVFPWTPITPEQFELVDGWTFADQASIDLIRNGGFSVVDEFGNTQAEYMGVITLGTLGSTDQVYFQQYDGGPAIDFVLTDAVNQCVQIYGDINNGDFDFRDYFKVFTREYAKLYAQSEIAEIGVSTLTYQVYRFPLTSGGDLKITHPDIDSDAYGVSVEYFESNQTRTIGDNDYEFNIIIDGNNRTIEEIYEAIQSLLRKDQDIDSGAGIVNGKTTDELLYFVGDILTTYPGVYIDNFLPSDTNSIEFFDINDIKRVFPYIAAGTLFFNDNFTNDSLAVYRMFYTDDLDDPNALFVPDADGNDISGIINAGEIQFSYDYDGNGAFDQYITIVAIGLDTGQYFKIDGTITRTTENNFTITGALEQNYIN